MSTAPLSPAAPAPASPAPATGTFPDSAPRRLRLVPEVDRHRTRRPTAAGNLPLTVGAELGVTTVHRTVVDYANFDHAATTPALVAVTEAVQKVTRRYGSVHRGAGYTSRVTTGWFEAAREQVATFVGAGADDEVVFTRNTTDALRLLAHALPRRTEVIVFESAHHAALLPWPARRTTRLPVPASRQDAVSLLTQALRRRDGHRPTLVVITGACNVTGDIWPVAELAAAAREHGARTVLDAAQLAPHRQVDLEAMGVDWVAFSGHKIYAPYGAGVLAGRRDWLDAAPPYLPAGGATSNVSHRHTQWQTGPARHEGGTPNAVGAIALATACATIAEHREVIEAHEATLNQRLRGGLAAVDGVRVHTVLGEEVPGVGVAAFTVDGFAPSLVSQALSDEDGIGVRDGRFCAHLLCDALFERDAGDDSTRDGTAVRASVGLSTTAEHVDRLLAAVRRLAEHGPALPYTRTSAGWVPEGDPRDLSEPLPW